MSGLIYENKIKTVLSVDGVLGFIYRVEREPY